jgi:hypothetical protein
MQQLLEAHNIPTRLLDLGLMPYTGLGSPAAIQVQPEDRETALILLSPLEEDSSAETDPQD